MKKFIHPSKVSSHIKKGRKSCLNFNQLIKNEVEVYKEHTNSLIAEPKVEKKVEAQTAKEENKLAVDTQRQSELDQYQEMRRIEREQQMEREKKEKEVVFKTQLSLHQQKYINKKYIFWCDPHKIYISEDPNKLKKKDPEYY